MIQNRTMKRYREISMLLFLAPDRPSVGLPYAAIQLIMESSPFGKNQLTIDFDRSTPREIVFELRDYTEEDNLIIISAHPDFLYGVDLWFTGLISKDTKSEITETMYRWLNGTV